MLILDVFLDLSKVLLRRVEVRVVDNRKRVIESFLPELDGLSFRAITYEDRYEQSKDKCKRFHFMKNNNTQVFFMVMIER